MHSDAYIEICWQFYCITHNYDHEKLLFGIYMYKYLSLKWKHIQKAQELHLAQH